MADVKIGFSQMSKPAPLAYRRFTSATILFFVPMLTGLAQGVQMSSNARNNCMLGIVAIPFLLKGIGMILGNGQVYSPTDEQVDDINKNIPYDAPGDQELTNKK